MLTLTHNGQQLSNYDVDGLRDLGVPTEVIGAALKEKALVSVAEFAELYRLKLATASAGKQTEYRIKEEIARDPSAASDIELELLSREAKARGTNRTGLIGQINAQAAAARHVALLIGALEAEAGAAISGIEDAAADIEVHIQTVLSAAKEQADLAFADAIALMHG